MAIWLKKANAVDLHTPKTGGMWRQAMYDALGIEYEFIAGPKTRQKRHSPFWDLDRDPAYVFGWVRNPLDWLLSFHRFMRDRWDRIIHGDGEWHPNNEIADYHINDFNKWVQQVEANHPGYVTRMFEQFVGQDGMHAVDKICRYERLVDDFADVLLKLRYGDHRKFLHGSKRVNVSPGATQSWDLEVRAFAYEREYAGISRFGYTSNHTITPPVPHGFTLTASRVELHTSKGEFGAAIDVLKYALKTYSTFAVHDTPLRELNLSSLSVSTVETLEARGIVTVREFMDAHYSFICSLPGIRGFKYRDIRKDLENLIEQHTKITKSRPQMIGT